MIEQGVEIESFSKHECTINVAGVQELNESLASSWISDIPPSVKIWGKLIDQYKTLNIKNIQTIASVCYFVALTSAVSLLKIMVVKATTKLNFMGAISFLYHLRPVGIGQIEVLILFNSPLVYTPGKSTFDRLIMGENHIFKMNKVQPLSQ